MSKQRQLTPDDCKKLMERIQAEAERDRQERMVMLAWRFALGWEVVPVGAAAAGMIADAVELFSHPQTDKGLRLRQPS